VRSSEPIYCTGIARPGPLLLFPIGVLPLIGRRDAFHLTSLVQGCGEPHSIDITLDKEPFRRCERPAQSCIVSSGLTTPSPPRLSTCV
jgi:hypothetical protein